MTEVELVQNSHVKSRFLTELDIIKGNNPGKHVRQLVRFLFLGLKDKDAESLILDYTGITKANSKVNGDYGEAIYFAEKAAVA